VTHSTSARERVETSVLDRPIDLTRIDRQVVLWGALLGLALLVRLVGLTSYPLAPAEAQLASDGLALLRGEEISSRGQAQPLPVLAAALALFLFGDGDGVVRMVPLLAGLATLLMLAQLRVWFGPSPALAAGLLLALSPAMTSVSTQLDGGALLLFGALATLATAARAVREPTHGSAFALGVAAAVVLLAHPLGWLVLAALAVWGLRARRSLLLQRLPTLLGSIAGTVLLASTALLSRPGGALGFLEGSIALLVREHLTRPLAGWPLPLVLLGTDELPSVLLALAALVSGVGLRLWSREPVPQPLAAVAGWTGIAVLAALLLGGKGPVLFGLLALPVALLGGIGLQAILETVDWRAARNPWDLAVTGSAATLLLALFSLIGRLLGGPRGHLVAWLAGLMTLTVVALGLAVLTTWLWRQALRPQSVFLTIPVAMLLLLGLRTSLLLNVTTMARPGELLPAGATSPGVRLLAERITRLSGDVTTFQTDVRDPTGGHGLVIALDPALEQPLRWYFREFPNVLVVRLTTGGPREPAPDVVIAPAGVAPELAASYPDIVFREYPLRSTLPTAVAEPDWQAVLAAPLDPRVIRRYLAFLINRQVQDVPSPERFTLGLRADLGERLYGPGAH
jgi:hypothetical protein